MVKVKIPSDEYQVLSVALGTLNNLLHKKLWSENQQQLYYLKTIMSIHKCIVNGDSKAIHAHLGTLESFAKQGHLDAKYVQACLTIRGHALGLNIPKDLAKGFDMLEELAKQKHIRSICALVSGLIGDTHKIKEKLKLAKRVEDYIKNALNSNQLNGDLLVALPLLYNNFPQLKSNNASNITITVN